MIRSFKAEWVLLNQRTTWLIGLAVAIAFAGTATALILVNEGSRYGELGAGGMTATTVRALSFGSVLMLAAFASLVGNEFTRGTYRAALLHQPRRLSLVAGKLLARMTVAIVLLAVALSSGALTATLMAPSQDVSTTDWFGLAGLEATATDFLRLTVWGLGWALIATTVAVLVRSTPIALGIVILWFGPVENVIGDDLEFGQRWFPGLLLESIVNPAAPNAVATPTAAWTWAIYAAVLITTLATVLKRRDVSS